MTISDDVSQVVGRVSSRPLYAGALMVAAFLAYEYMYAETVSTTHVFKAADWVQTTFPSLVSDVNGVPTVTLLGMSPQDLLARLIPFAPNLLWVKEPLIYGASVLAWTFFSKGFSTLTIAIQGLALSAYLVWNPRSSIKFWIIVAAALYTYQYEMADVAPTTLR